MIPINNKIDSIWNQKYVVIDVETTGHDPHKNRITEIAYVLVEGGEIIKEYSSLVNPHQFIPHFIAKMTGISNEMAFKAPEASTVMKHIADILDNKNVIFVAHNVSFDFNFVQSSLAREGYNFPSVPRLCTYKLAKNLLPAEQKKNVGALAQYFDIKIKNRHRAFDDAKATALILIEFLEMLEKKHDLSEIEEVLSFHDRRNNNHRLKNNVSKEFQDKIKSLPEGPGIYKFYDEGKNIIYLGKSKNIQSRVRSYFAVGSLKTRKELELYNCIKDVGYEDTNSELSALLLENKLIKEYQPYFNKKQKKTSKYPFIKLTVSEMFPKIYITENIDNDGADYFGPFRNVTLAEQLIKIIDDNFKLIKCTNYSSHKQCDNCIYNKLNQCIHPELSKDNNDYVIEVENVKDFLNGFSSSLINDLEVKMLDYAEHTKYEEAALLRDQIKDLKMLYEKCQSMPTSIDNNNFIFMEIDNYREKTINYYFIYKGTLKLEKTVGKLANYDFSEIINNIYIKNISINSYSDLNIEEMRILNSWLNKNYDAGEIIHTHNKTVEQIVSEMNSALKSFIF